LPWQDTGDAYRVWLSEIMLQQTQVGDGHPVLPALRGHLPDVRALAAAPDRSRARALERARLLPPCAPSARRGETRRRGPRRRVSAGCTALATLPGIGRSTAAAIAALAYGARTAILDGNVKRVLARHRGIAGYPGAPKVEAALWQAAEALLPEADTAIYTQALMDLGATLCTRTRPRCDVCRSRTIALRAATTASPSCHRPAAQAAAAEGGARAAVRARGRDPAGAPSGLGIWGGLWSLPGAAARRRPPRLCAHALRRRGRARRCARAHRAWLHAFRAHAASAADGRAYVAAAGGSAGPAVARARRGAGRRAARTIRKLLRSL
jgi:A/G-specific adenine glycosylase